jgi:transcription initiation factor TFIIH subunit 2
MGDSDYEFDGDDGSDEEYVGSRDSSTSRAQTVGKRKVQPKATERKAHAWARRGSTPPEEESEYVPAEEEEEEEDTTPQKSLQQIEEERKRKRYVTRCVRLGVPFSRAG